MNTTTHRRAIRFYSHILKVCGYPNTKRLGIVHHYNGASTLWASKGMCVVDRTPDEIFIDNGLSETQARKLLVAMCKAAIARVEKLN